MSKAAARPLTIDVDLSVVGNVLERVRPAISGEDYTCLEGVVSALVELSKLVRERGTTIARLRRLFGLSSSEKTADVLGGKTSGNGTQDVQTEGSGDADTDSDSTEASEDRETTDSGAAPDRAPKRKGHGRIPASNYPNARRTEVPHQTLRAGNVCPCCARSKIYRLREPACILRIKGQAPLVADVWNLEQFRCGGCGKVFTARPPAEAQGPKYDESAVSMMALLRYGTGMPLYRLDGLQRHLETPVPASTQWEVVRDHKSALDPVHDELSRLAAQAQVLHNDDTSIRILEFMGKRRAKLLAKGELPDPDRTGMFTTATVAITDAGPIALFFTGRKHAGENLSELLDRRDPGLPPPVQMCDGLDRNVPANHDVVESNCMAHGRRHVVDEVDNFPEECGHVLEALGEVFNNESTCKKKGLRGEERLRFHQAKSGPVLSELEKWLEAQLDEKRVEPNSGLGQAFRYLLKRWDKLTLFLRVPDAPVDNNLCERILKMAIRHRNNSLFYRSARGAKVGDVYMTLIHTAELHRKNPFDYLVALLEHEADVAAAPADWLPWTYRATLAALAAKRAA